MATVSHPWTSTLATLRERWMALALRERQALTVAAWVLGLALLWFVGIAPAWRTAGAAPARLDQLDTQMLLMQRLSGEARSFRGAPAVGIVQAQAAVKAASDALGGAARLTLTGERATVTFTNASSAQLREWLSEVRVAARARPVEASLNRSAQGYSGTVVLALPGGAS